jgi:protein TonB
MAYADQQMSGSRIFAIIIVALIHIALGYALVTGLAYSAFKKAVERVTTVDIEEPPPPEEEPPPPPPDQVQPPPIVAPPPPLSLSPPTRLETVPEPPPPQREVVTNPNPPPPPPPPSKARGAQPEGQRSWQQRIMDNYPARAVRDEIEGRVGVRVTVGPNGRVAGCSVTSSSGESVLDQAACQDITRYARFNPALDDAGNPTTGSWGTTIVYTLGN